MTAIIVATVAASALAYAVRPPRPNLTLPSGYQLIRVHGHCVEGDELFQCSPGDGPRSSLTIQMPHAATEGFQQVRDHLLAHGWQPVNGHICRHGQGCLSLHGKPGDGRMLLDWWQTEHTECRGQSSFSPDPVDCAVVR